MSELMLKPPERIGGTTEEQLKRLYSYLYQMAEQLNLAVNSIDSSNLTEDVQKGIAQATPKQELRAEANNLKQLIIKSADLVRQEMDTLFAELSGKYIAQSDFGTYVQKLSNQIQADPTGIQQYYSFISEIQADLSATDASFQSYISETQGYIRTGIVEYDGETPVFGVAVGQGLTTTTVDGNAYVTSAQFRSVFTATKLSFYQGDNEVAYLSNNRLYIANITILGTVQFHNEWEIDTTNGFSLRWIG